MEQTQRERIIKLFPTQYNAYNFFTQFGAVAAGVQCLAEDEFIYTPTGVKAVKDIKNGDKILGGIVRNRHEFENDEIFEMIFNNGVKIKTNKEHPFYCRFLARQKEGWAKLEDIKNVLEKGYKLRPKAKVYFYDRKILEDIKDVVKSPKLLGYILSDGTFKNGQSVKFTNTNYGFIDEVRKLSIEFNGLIKPKLYKKGRGWDLLLTTGNKGMRNPIKKYVNSLGITEDSFGRLLNAGEKEKVEFIRGYFNGDGYLSIDKNRDKRKDVYLIGFCVGISRRQAVELQYLLWSLGFRSHIRTERFKENKRLFYRVVIDRNSAGELLKLLDWSKYPNKFYEASLIKTENIRNKDSWISVLGIKSIGKGRVVGWETEGTNEIISYCGIKTHNSGKTFTGVYWAGKKIQEFPQGTGIIVSPTYKILQQATLKKFFDVFPELRRYYKEQKGEINLPTGGTIFIRSADNPLGIEGITAHWVLLDEGGMCSVLTWTVLRSRVSMTGGQILITTTPYNMGWLYTDFYLPWKEKRDASLSFFSWASIENPYFSKEFYEAEKGRLRPEEFSRRYMGEFRKMTGLVWDMPETQIVDKLEKNIKTEERIMGVDWGYRNPAAISVLYLRDKTWYVVDEWRLAERTTPEIIQVIKNKSQEHNINKIYPDPAEPDRIEECRRAGLPIMEANKDITGGISNIQQLIREKRFFICRNCFETIDEFSMYHYSEDKDDEENKELPEKFNDHLCDCIRYAIHSFEPTIQGIGIASEPIKPYYEDLGF